MRRLPLPSVRSAFRRSFELGCILSLEAIDTAFVTMGTGGGEDTVGAAWTERMDATTAAARDDLNNMVDATTAGQWYG